MALSIIVDAKSALAEMNKILTKFGPAVREAGESSAKQTSLRVRANLMETVARKRAGPLWNSITYTPGILPQPNVTTDISATYSGIDYAEQIEEGSIALGINPEEVSASQIGDWWEAVIGHFDGQPKIVYPSYGRGSGQHMFHKAIPFAESIFKIESEKAMIEVTK